MNFQELKNKLRNQLKKNLPFVVYHKPNSPNIVALLENSTQIYPVDYSEQGFAMIGFNNPKLAHFIRLSQAKKINSPYLPNQLDFQSKNQPIKEKSIAKSSYENKIKQSINFIENTKVEKVVFSRKIEVESQQNLVQAFENLLCLYEDAFTYLWHHPKLGTWLGATPETLVSLNRNRLTTMALAGTKLASNKAAENWGSKEKEEQNYVTKAIVNELKKYSEKINIGTTSSKKAGKLLHLHTPITAQINPSDLAEILKYLHPTPAVAGFPKKEAVDYILANEAYERKYYTGFLGEVNFPQEVNKRKHRKNQEFTAVQPRIPLTELYVNLRCMEFDNQRYTLYVGGGITKESKPSDEWEETKNKSQTMLNVL